MYIKVFPHGQGGRGPIDYLLRLDYPGREESPPVILRDNADITRKWKFSAGFVPGGRKTRSRRSASGPIDSLGEDSDQG